MVHFNSQSRRIGAGALGWQSVTVPGFAFQASVAVLVVVAVVSFLSKLVTDDGHFPYSAEMIAVSQGRRRTSVADDGDTQTPSRLPKSHRYFETCHGRRTDVAPASMEPKLSLAQIRNFTSGGYNNIPKGSGDINLVGPMITQLSLLQHNLGIFGTVGEMGVHHGKFTGFLYVTARKTEQLIAADLFALQQLNVDLSGLGDLKQFLKGLRSYGIEPRRDIHYIFQGSTDRLPERWADAARFHPFRMISVDAGHTAALTFNDLQVAFCNAAKGGIVILDDFFHSGWPGVTEGFFQFAAMGPEPNVYPLLRCENKLFVTNDAEYHAKYYDMLSRIEDPIHHRNLTSPYAVVSRRGNVLYEMNGINYIHCLQGQLSDEDIQRMWTEMVY
jgi:Methyltransferase domain